MGFFGRQFQRARSLAGVILSLRHYLADKAHTEAVLAGALVRSEALSQAIDVISKKNDTITEHLNADREILEAERVAFAQNNARVLDQLVVAAARHLALAGDHRQIPAFEISKKANAPERKLRIGLFDNLANQAYITARALRKLGHDVEVVIQENGFDIYPLARPQWEDCEVDGVAPGDFKPEILDWEAPEFVRFVPYDHEMHNRYVGRAEAAQEVVALYREHFGKDLPRDTALVLAQHMAQWNYISAMNDYDVVMLSMSAIMLGVFSPKPVVICPLGGDLYIRGFDQDVTGLMFRAGFRQAAHLSLPETDYFSYIERMEAKAPRSFMPLIVDTDVYVPGDEPGLRAEWKAQVGGEQFLLGVCRQDWEWKGSDKLIRAFARFRARPEGKDWRLLLQAWGADIERSRALASELGLDDVTLWLSMCSKPLLRRRQRAADAVADQFVMEGYGASVLEALAAGKPVMMRPVPESARHHFRNGPPPFVAATTEDDIVAALRALSTATTRDQVGDASRAWVEAEHGYKILGPHYMKMFEAAASYPHGG